MPIILGDGIKLFGELPIPVFLGNQNLEPHKSGMVQIEYTIKNAK